MGSGIDKQGWEGLWTVIQGSFAISRHVDFFRWLQDEVCEFLPHDVLVAVWGDFAKGRLSYDVASNIPEIHTQHITSGCDVDPLMRDLYKRWRAGGEKWYVLDDFKSSVPDLQANSCITALGQMRSLLVHGILDRRGSDDCLYVFLDKDVLIKAQPSVMEILVPQIDAVLRRVECLAPVVQAEAGPGRAEDGISDREHEIMNWVRHGKTNHEIGMILSISPNTVKNHLKRIFQKMEVSSRAQAAAKYSVLASADMEVPR